MVVGLIKHALAWHLPSVASRFASVRRGEDRVILETKILPTLRDDPNVRRILFVGAEWYTKHYEAAFRDHEYWTLEIDAKKSHFGARNHIIAPLQDLAQHRSRNYFDAIICNGVFMIGALEAYDHCEQAFDACHQCLRPGGWFVLGWNDTEALRPYPPSDSPALAKFELTTFPALGASEFRTSTDGLHTYRFYRRCDG